MVCFYGFLVVPIGDYDYFGPLSVFLVYMAVVRVDELVGEILGVDFVWNFIANGE